MQKYMSLKYEPASEPLHVYQTEEESDSLCTNPL